MGPPAWIGVIGSETSNYDRPDAALRRTRPGAGAAGARIRTPAGATGAENRIPLLFAAKLSRV